MACPISCEMEEEGEACWAISNHGFWSYTCLHMMHQHLTLYFKEMPQLCHGDVLLLPSVPARGKEIPVCPQHPSRNLLPPPKLFTDNGMNLILCKHLPKQNKPLGNIC